MSKKKIKEKEMSLSYVISFWVKFSDKEINKIKNILINICYVTFLNNQ